jgi:TatD DNase family protein
VDLHVHLDLYDDHAALVGESDREAVATLAVTTTPKAWRRNCEVAAGSRYVRVALGLHPQLVSERASEVALFEGLLSEARYVGEVGLDSGPRFYRNIADQERVFERILRACAEQGGKILTVHSVRAAGKVLDHLERHMPPSRGVAVLHWFTGTAAEARRAAELGCYFSVNREMLRSPRHRALVSGLPINRLLTETDGPFVMHNGRALRPYDVAATVEELAVARGLPTDILARQIVRNLATLVGR